MRNPLDAVNGRVVGYDTKTQELLIRAPYSDWFTMTKRNFKECLVQPIDSRPLSDKQRKMCYALLREISDFTGQDIHSTKEYLKIRFLADDFGETADKIFSLSNGAMSLVCAYQRYLIRFILDYDIPCRFPLLDFVDDVADYIYSCLVNKKCCVCGRRADLHHCDHVGMGRDRNEIIHEGMIALPLCREHHTECHTIGQKSFEDKYHLIHGIELDKTLCRLYGLKRRARE